MTLESHEYPSMHAAPKVTVLIPVYNREQYVARAIQSILTQTFVDFELLLIDDGSTDLSVARMQSFLKHPRVRLAQNAHNMGIPQTRNKGIALALGEYLAMLDSDDWAAPERLAKQVAFLDRHPEYAVVGSWAEMCAVDYPDKHLRTRPASAADVHARLLFQCPLIHTSIMTRTAVLREYRYREQYSVCEDFDLFARLARRYQLGNIPEPLVRSTKDSSSITRSKASLVREHKLAIIEEQLSELGVSYTTSDLERHFLLPRMGKTRFSPDTQYLEWADVWLHRLQTANSAVGLYPPEAFSRFLGELWFKACRSASRTLGCLAWRCFIRSSLPKGNWLRMLRLNPS